MGEDARGFALILAEELRDASQEQRIIVDCSSGKLKSQLKKADASGAQLALIIGDDEIAGGQVTVKHLRESVEQKTIQTTQLVQYIAEFFSKE